MSPSAIWNKKYINYFRAPRTVFIRLVKKYRTSIYFTMNQINVISAAEWQITAVLFISWVLFGVFQSYSTNTQVIIKFKIATITFKVLKNRKPSYLLDLLQPHNPQRSLRSSDKLLLDTPKIKTALATRSFAHAAPSVWNSLPFDLRNSSSLHSFTTHLKTHLFPP